MSHTFKSGDRIVQRRPFDLGVGRRGTFIAGPGEHPTERPGNFLIIGDEYAVVQFDDGEIGQAQVARLDELQPEAKS